mgnify:CR=1 FL=1
MEAPDEMGHQGSVERKIQSIEYLDQRLIRLVKEGLDASGEDYRMLILPDHPTPVKVRTHVAEPVPYLLYDSTAPRSHNWHYNEKEALESGNQSRTRLGYDEISFRRKIMLIVKKFGGTSVANKERILMLPAGVSRIIKWK